MPVVNDPDDELDAALDSGRARWDDASLRIALGEAAGWAEARTQRRRRGVRSWIAAGVVAGLLGGGAAVATAMGGGGQPQVMGTSVMLAYTTTTGAVCQLEIQPVVRTADPSVRAITVRYLENVDVAELDVGRGVEALVGALSRGAEQEILRLRGAAVDVTLLADHSCAEPVASDGYGVTVPIAGEDFGREPTVQPGRPPDAVIFFRTSTGQICEMQMKVDPDWGSGATLADGALAARAYLATVDVAALDISAALAETADYDWLEMSQANREAHALRHVLVREAGLAHDPAGEQLAAISIETWVSCDREPTE